MSITCWLKRFLGLTTMVALVLMTAMSVAAPSAQARPLTTGIKGIVVAADTGKPVGGVTVHIMQKWYPWGEQFNGQDWALKAVAQGVTGKNGAYTVKLPEAGTYRVFFVPGDLTRYAMEAYPNAPVAEAGDDVVTRYGQTTNGVSVRLDPSNRIEGHVYAAESRWNADGEDDGSYEPLTGVTVRVCFQSLVVINCYIRMPEDGAVPFGGATTDGDGFYSIPGFKAFRFFAWANPQTGAPDDPAYDPGLSDLMIDPGGSAFPDGVKTSDAFLQSTDLANITGRLVDGEGNGLAGRTVLVSEVDQSEQDLAFFEQCAVTTDDDGYFGVSPDDVPCLNLLEPAALLRFQGDDEYLGQYYGGYPGGWDYAQIEVRWGWTTDIGDWVLTPVEVGE